jgi:hypothetical protein
MRRSGVRIALMATESFAAVLAIGGGIAVATGADRFPAFWLVGTPFSNYMIPGLILAAVVGGSAAAGVVTTLRCPGTDAQVSLLAGMLLMGWIVGEILILKQSPPGPTWTEIFYFAIGLLISVLALRLERIERGRRALPGGQRQVGI